MQVLGARLSVRLAQVQQTSLSPLQQIASSLLIFGQLTRVGRPAATATAAGSIYRAGSARICPEFEGCCCQHPAAASLTPPSAFRLAANVPFARATLFV